MPPQCASPPCFFISSSFKILFISLSSLGHYSLVHALMPFYTEIWHIPLLQRGKWNSRIAMDIETNEKNFHTVKRMNMSKDTLHGYKWSNSKFLGCFLPSEMLNMFAVRIDHLICHLRNLYAGQEATVRTEHGTVQISSKSGKEYIKAVYCHSAHLTYMQSTSCEMPGWMKHKLESRLLGEISTTSDTADDTTLMAEVKRN